MIYSAATPAAPALPVHPHQLEIVQRLHRLATSVPPRYPVAVTAEDLLALLNGFWQESRRADQAQARLESLTAERPSPAATN